MPKVPTYDNLQQSQNVLPNVAVRNAASTEMFTAGAKQMQDLGEAQQHVGGQLGDMAVDMQKEANRLRVDDAMNRAREEALRLTYDKDVGFRNLRGLQALERPDGKPLTEEYAAKLQQTMGTLAQGLGNDAQRQAFMTEGNNLLNNFRQSTMQHEGEEFRTYSMSVREGAIANRVNEIGFNWNNPQAVNEAIDSIRASTYDLGRQKGLSAAEIEANVRTATSRAHLTAIAAALQNNNPRYAEQYLKRYSGQMEADDMLRAQGVMTKQLDAQLASQVVGEVFRDASPKMDPSGFDRLMRITHMSESGGRVLNADGTPIIRVNSNGTRDLGPFQINEKSGPELAKLAGVEWDEELAKTDEVYGFMLAQTYMLKNLQDFGGNVAQAISAYNAGPTATREAIEQAKRDGGDWIDYIPASTRDRVRKDVAEYQRGGGQGQRPTLLDIQNQVREHIGDSNPERLNMALQLAERQYNDQTKAIEQRQDEAVATAMQTLINNGGSYASLPAEVRSAIPPDKVGSVIDFAKKLAAGEDAPTDWALYYALKSDATLLGSTNLLAVRNRLSDSEFKELTNAQQETRRGGNQTQVRSVKDTLNQYLVEAGINPDPKPDDTANAARVGRVWSMFENRVRAREADLGHKLSPDELNKEAARLMTHVLIGSSFFDWNTSVTQMPAAAADPAKDNIIVPADERPRIEEGLRAAGKPVTDENVRALYLRGRLGQ